MSLVEKLIFKLHQIKSASGILYPFNSYSSYAYLILLVHFYNTSINLFNLFGILNVNSLIISSYLWCGYQDEYIQKKDIFLYSSIILYVGYYYLYHNTIIEDEKNNIIILFLINIYFLVLIIINDFRTLLRIINYSSVFFSIGIVVNNKYNYNIEKGLILKRV